VAYADIDAIDLSAAGTKQVDVAHDVCGAIDGHDRDDRDRRTGGAAGRHPPAAPEMNADRTGVYNRRAAGWNAAAGERSRDFRSIRHSPDGANVAGAVVIRGIVRKDGTIDKRGDHQGTSPTASAMRRARRWSVGSSVPRRIAASRSTSITR